MIKVYEEKEAPHEEYALRLEQDEGATKHNRAWVVIVDAHTGKKVFCPYLFSIGSNGIERSIGVNEKAMKALGIAVHYGQIDTD